MQIFLDYLLKKYETEIFDLKKKIDNFKTLENSTSSEDCLFLSLIIKEFKPKRILEIGTFVGKSTYSISLACEENNQEYSIDTIDIKNNINHKRFEFNSNINFYIGHSSEILKKIKKEYDLVFIDGNLDFLTTDYLTRLCSKKTIIVSHDFVLPYDKGISNLAYILKFVDQNIYKDFHFLCPRIHENYNSELVRKILKKKNNNTTINHHKINKCCSIIFFEKKFNNLKNFDREHYTKKNFYNINSFVCDIIYYIKKYFFKNKDYIIINKFNYIFVLDLHEFIFNVSIKKNKFFYFRGIYFLKNFEGIKNRLKKLLLFIK